MTPMKKYIIPHLRVAELDMKDGILDINSIPKDGKGDNGDNALDVKGQAAWDGWSDEDDNDEW